MTTLLLALAGTILLMAAAIALGMFAAWFFDRNHLNRD